MKEENKGAWRGGVIVLVFIAVCVFIVTVFTYSCIVAWVCGELGWIGGGAHDAYDGYCFERNEERSEYRECDLQYVLAGACEPMWPDAE